jgi:hypothetical protein
MVETETSDDDKPSTNSVNPVEIASTEANKHLLHHVLGQADVA